MLHCSRPACQCAVQLCSGSSSMFQATKGGRISTHGVYMQSAKEDLQSFGFVVVEMVRDACRDTISCLEVKMNETLGRTSKLVRALSRSAGSRRGESQCSVATLQVLNTAFGVQRAMPCGMYCRLVLLAAELLKVAVHHHAVSMQLQYPSICRLMVHA